MAKCPYCGESAGVFRKQHEECSRKYDEAEKAVWSSALAALSKEVPLDGLPEKIQRAAAQGRLTEERRLDLIVAAWEGAVERLLDDELLSEEEEEILSVYATAFDLQQPEMNRNYWLQRMVVASVLRSLTEGVMPQRFKVDGPLPFNLQKSETLIWLFADTACYEERSRREYVGGYQGISVRIAKGLYYRTGSFKGHPVDTSYLHHVDTGLLGLTDKHLYFHGTMKGFRLPYKKIASYNAHADGITVQKEAMTAKPLTFVTGDGWSTFNLVMNLAYRTD